MSKAALAVLAIALAGCTVATRALDERTGTTLADRCADYDATLATYDALALTRKLTEAEATAWAVAKAFVTTTCPPPVTTLPAGPALAD